ncbi:hypothetical protein BDF14DRAFT_1815877 [Spinellus fusiger]|nr:hypothetical protein BDF14DRAFT_1815877 [Spinellus fusiger]
MHTEITQAVDFLARLLQSKLDQERLVLLKNQLTDLLAHRFVDHWDPLHPYRGNGFRALSNFNGQLDPVLALAANNADIPVTCIDRHLPRDFVLWIDPFSVSYRVGDHGNIMTLFEDRSRGRSPMKTEASTRSPKSSHTNSHPLHYIQPRASTPIRISPPSSPDGLRLTRNYVHQSSPLAKQPKIVTTVGKQEQPLASPPEEEDQQQHLVLAN